MKSRKMVQGAENTISDTSSLNSRRYEIFEVSPLTIVENRKTVKGDENTICDVHWTHGDMRFLKF